MYNHNFVATALKLLILLLPCVLITLTGCGTVSQVAPSESNSQPLPIYKPGTTFVYSDGSWEVVTDSTPHQVTWRDHRGNVYEGSPDFTYSPENWRSADRKVSRRFTSRGNFMVGEVTSLWPLKKGKKAVITEFVISRKNGAPEKSYRRSWTCMVVGPEQVTVMAGEFYTWKIACRRYNNYQNLSKAKLREIRTWNYAPEINHYVLAQKQFFTGKADRRLELLAVLPTADGLPSSAQVKMQETFQKALEFQKSGDTIGWSTRGASLSGKITPTATFRLPDGRFSRQYVQTVKFGDEERTYYGLAIRNSEGNWEIPRRQ